MRPTARAAESNYGQVPLFEQLEIHPVRHLPGRTSGSTLTGSAGAGTLPCGWVRGYYVEATAGSKHR